MRSEFRPHGRWQPAERLVAGDCDAEVLRSRTHDRGERRRMGLRVRRDFANAGQIDASGDRVAGAFDDCVALGRLVRRRQAEMALAHNNALIAADRAEHRNVGVALQRLPQLGGLPFRSDLVENDARDLRVAVEGGVALHQGRHSARHAAGVDDKHDRRRATSASRA